MMPGRELDALVAERVMGWVREYLPLNNPVGYRNGESFRLPEEVPHYSTDIAAAWQVVERFRRLNYDVALHTTAADGWVCAFRGALLADAMQAATPAHAICLAALRACGVEVEA